MLHRLLPLAYARTQLLFLFLMAVFAACSVAPTASLPATIEGAERPVPDYQDGTWSLTFENDSVAGADGNYTSGLAFGWTSGSVEQYPEGSFTQRFLWFGQFLPFVRDPEYQNFVSFSLSQHMFTATDIEVEDPPETERPYAGGVFFDSTIYARGKSSLHAYSMRLGFIGPISFAEQVQRGVHKATGSKEPKGWDTQLYNEPIVNFAYNALYHEAWHRFRSGLETDVLPSFGVYAGNYFTGARLGVLLRVGSGLKHTFGTSSLRSGFQANSVITDAPTEQLRWSAFLGLDGYGIAHYIPLDGNTYRKSRSVDREDFVGSYTMGVSATRGDFTFSAARTGFTKSFAHQRENDEFATVSLGWKFAP